MTVRVFFLSFILKGDVLHIIRTPSDCFGQRNWNWKHDYLFIYGVPVFMGLIRIHLIQTQIHTNKNTHYYKRLRASSASRHIDSTSCARQNLFNKIKLLFFSLTFILRVPVFYFALLGFYKQVFFVFPFESGWPLCAAVSVENRINGFSDFYFFALLLLSNWKGNRRSHRATQSMDLDQDVLKIRYMYK